MSQANRGGGVHTGIAGEDHALARVGPLALTAQLLDSYAGKSPSCSPGVLWLPLCHLVLAGLSQEETSGPGPSAGGGRGACPAPLTPPGPAGESIPIRLFLAGYELTPTMRDINKKFSVRYYLNLVLIDDEERRYFKQQVGAGGMAAAGGGAGPRAGAGPGRGRGRAGRCLCRLVQPERPGRCLCLLVHSEPRGRNWVPVDTRAGLLEPSPRGCSAFQAPWSAGAPRPQGMDSCLLAGDQEGLCLRVPGTLPRPPLTCPSPCAARPLRLPRPLSLADPHCRLPP